MKQNTATKKTGTGRSADRTGGRWKYDQLSGGWKQMCTGTAYG